MPIDDSYKSKFDILAGLHDDDLYSIKSSPDIRKLFKPTIKPKRDLKARKPVVKKQLPTYHLQKKPVRETVVALGQRRKHITQQIRTTVDPIAKAKLHKDYYETSEKIEKAAEAALSTLEDLKKI
jgi:hypothetical protein|tara:strand:- start:3006 stop:3380 length:375 start_codon:yes stop_codon:yes gene_type:complete